MTAGDLEGAGSPPASGDAPIDAGGQDAADATAPVADGMLGLRGRTRHAVERMAPPGSSARGVLRLARQVAKDGIRYGDRLRRSWALARATEGAEPGYRRWLQDHRPTVDALVLQTDSAIGRRIRTRLDVVVLGGEGAGATLDSLSAQTFRGWTATVVGADIGGRDDRVSAAPDRTAAEVLAAVAGEGDPDDMVVVLEAGDRLEPDFAFNVAARAWDNPFAVLVGWDDDLTEAARLVGDPRFRPSWSPEMLLGANYLGRSFAIRRGRLAAAGGLRTEDGDAAWWDLLLRLDLGDDHVVRIPRVLHHLVRRPEVGPERAVEVVRAHLARTGRAGEVSATAAGARVRWALPDPPHVTIVIPTRHNREMLSVCLPSLAKTDYPSFDVHRRRQRRAHARQRGLVRRRPAGLDLDVRWWDEPFNYSAVNNRAAAGARGDVLVFLNDDTELLDPGWLRELVSWVRQPDIGLVGVQLIGPDGEIQHGGVMLGLNGFADHLFEGLRPGDDASSAPRRGTATAVGHGRVPGRRRRAVRGGRGLRRAVPPVRQRRRARARRRASGASATWSRRSRASATSSRPPAARPPSRTTSSPATGATSVGLRGGDPYFSPNLSLRSTVPQLRRLDEPDPLVAVGGALGRDFRVFRQRTDEAESLWLADLCRADERVRPAVDAQHRAERKPFPVRTVNWFLPDIDSPFYGGINTAFRMADHLARTHDVQNRFVVMAAPNETFIRSALSAAFPGLGDSAIEFYEAGRRVSTPCPGRTCRSPRCGSRPIRWPTSRGRGGTST